MKKLLGTTAIGLALAVSPAMAGPDTDVTQSLSDAENGSQTATTSASGLNVLNMDQSSSNLGNLLDKVGDYDDITQDVDIPQSSQNILVPEGSSVKNLEQSASNTANYVNIIDGTTGDVYDDFSQSVDGGGIDVQKSINRISINDDEGPDLAIENVTQSATNTGNYANIDDSFGGPFTQAWDNDDDNQVARNSIVGDDNVNDDNVENSLKNVEQTAGNYANLLFADDFRDGSDGFEQTLALSVDQTATNTAWFELFATEVDQTASNTANYADVNGVDGSAVQETGDLADQVARNALLREDANDNGTGSVTKTSQAASNFGNIFTSKIEVGGDRPEQDKSGNQSPDPKVEQLEQDFGDSQRATNVVSFGDKLGTNNGKFRPDTTQDATNVMNMAEVQEFDDTLGGGTLAKQTAAGVGNDGEPAIQLASNNAFFEGGGSERGNVTDFSQSASNLANLMYSGNLPSFGVQEFDQTLKVPQLATSTITTIGNLTEVSQSSSNVGNVLSDLD